MSETQKFSREQLVQMAEEAADREAAYIAQLNNLPFRLAEARREADSAFNIATWALQRGESTHVPALDLSHVQSIKESEPELKEKAFHAGLDKLRLYQLVYERDQREHTEAVEALEEPLRELEEQYARVGEELKKVREARMTADKKASEAFGRANQYRRAWEIHQQMPNNPIRRMG